jgi:two-component system, sensor histidine kinase and response regulator
LENIMKSAERMFAIVRNLLDVNAIESGNFRFAPSPIDLEDSVRELVGQYQYQASLKNITFSIEAEAGGAVIHVNPDSITQILDNLVSNALKYSPHHSEVVIRIRKLGGKVRCEIQDKGEGVTESDKVKLFGKFSQLSARPTADEQSTGLGLFIVKKLVEAMNGTVWCESEYRKGATFIIEFVAA